MATNKPVTVLDNNVTLTAGAGDHTSSIWTITDGYNAAINVKVTNGATGPTIAATWQIWTSPDNSNWYLFGGEVGTALGNNAISSIGSIDLRIGTKYAKVVSGTVIASVCKFAQAKLYFCHSGLFVDFYFLQRQINEYSFLCITDPKGSGIHAKGC